MKTIRQDVQAYIEREILPRYDSFDAAHRRDHVEMVIRQSLELAEQTGADAEMAYVIASYHVQACVKGASGIIWFQERLSVPTRTCCNGSRPSR